MKKYLTITEVADLAGVHSDTVRRNYWRIEFAKNVPANEKSWLRRGEGVTSKLYLHRDVAVAMRDAYSIPTK